MAVDDHRVARGDAVRTAVEGDQDARARLVVLTERGWACTRAAEEAAAEAVGVWVELLSEGEVRALRDQLARIAPYGPIRPNW
ncbi:marR family transcriptional regulator [Streptomyces sp. NL15-2K]|nr:marR family transcriptional regulator [Streptomyces sp. NL15-2K]